MTNETLLSVVLVTLLLAVFVGVGKLYITSAQTSRFNRFAFTKVTQNIGKDSISLNFKIGEDKTASYQKRGNQHFSKINDNKNNKKVEMTLYEKQ